MRPRFAALLLSLAAVTALVSATSWLVRSGPTHDASVAHPAGYRYQDRTFRPAVGRSAPVALLPSGRAKGLVLRTPESRPQAVMTLDDDGVHVGASAEPVIATVEPVALPDPAPPGAVLSNAYALTFRSGRRLLSLSGEGTAQVQLRTPSATDRTVVVQLFLDGDWSRLPTRRLADDAFEARLTGLGTVVATVIPSPETNGAAGGRTTVGLLAATTTLVALVLWATRRRGAGPPLVRGSQSRRPAGKGPGSASQAPPG